MTSYRLRCPCGYASNPVPSGADAWSPTFFVPVVIPGDLRLCHVEITPRPEESEDSFEARLESAIAQAVSEQLGSQARAMNPLAMNGVRINCPKCGEALAEFEFVGF